MAIINYERVAQTSVKTLMADPKISKKNKKDFEVYLDGIEVSPSRIGIITNHIKKLFYEMPDVVGSMRDRMAVNRAFKNLKMKSGPGYHETMKKVGKAFVRWHNKGNTPEGWIDIKGNGKGQKRNLRRDDMVTWDDGLALANATNSVQIKAAIMTQLDGGFRPSEFIELNYGDIKKKGSFLIAHVKDGKTGDRDVILFKSVPFLQRWLRAHPSEDPKGPLWIQENQTRRIKRYNYHALLKRVNFLKAKIKLQKPVDLYNLRHSACFGSKLDNVNVELASKKFGHSAKFYIETYGRLAIDDDVKRYQKHYGVGNQKDKEKETPLECIKCGTVNDPGIVRCEQCSNPLTIDEALKSVQDIEKLKKTVDLLSELIGDPEGIKKLREAMEIVKSKA